MNIKAYLKPYCGWSRGVRAIFLKYNLSYEDVDIINNPKNYEEMVQKSGQKLCPCIEVDGIMLADISGEELEAYLLAHNLVQPNSEKVNVPTNQGCSVEEHLAKKRAGNIIRFF